MLILSGIGKTQVAWQMVSESRLNVTATISSICPDFLYFLIIYLYYRLFFKRLSEQENQISYKKQKFGNVFETSMILKPSSNNITPKNITKLLKVSK